MRSDHDERVEVANHLHQDRVPASTGGSAELTTVLFPHEHKELGQMHLDDWNKGSTEISEDVLCHLIESDGRECAQAWKRLGPL